MSKRYTVLRYHLILGSPGLHMLKASGLHSRLCSYISGMVTKRQGVMLAIDSVQDRLHMLAGLPPTIAAEDALETIRKGSSWWVNTHCPSDSVFEWYRGHGMFAVSDSQVQQVRSYIHRLGSHGRTFSEELDLIGHRHGLAQEWGKSTSRRYARLCCHLVFTTKDRHPMITSALEQDLYPYISDIVTEWDAIMLEANGMEDHIHILADLPPSVSVAKAVKGIKGRSSWWIDNEWSAQPFFKWQPGYGAFTVSVSRVARVQEYIRNQKNHHRKHSHEDELHFFEEYCG